METTTYVVIATIILTLMAPTTLTSACPVSCSCRDDGDSSHVTCVYEGLTEVPGGLPANATFLDLQGNRISSLTNVFPNFTEVQILDLSFNDITELRAEDFLSMSNLRELTLQGNQIGELYENFFQVISKLEVLNLANNSIASLHSAILFSLDHLYLLNLSGNLINWIAEDSFLFPESLSQLDLSNNKIRELPNTSLQNLYQLQVLNLQHNSINVLDGKIFPEFNNLTDLDVSQNSIARVVSNASFSGISHLDLSSNNISEASDMGLDQFVSLVNLTVDGNPLVSINIPVFSSLHSLEYLSFSHMPKLEYLFRSTFEGLTNLTMLNLSYNTHMSFIHKDLFRFTPHISIIDLRYNNITRLYNETFQSMSQLTELYLTGNNFTCDCGIAWMLQEIENTSSSLTNREFLDCVMPDTQQILPMMQLEIDSLVCGDVKIVNHSGDSAFKIGHPAILQCEVAETFPRPEIVWITPRNRVFKYHDFHQYATLDYLSINSSLEDFIQHQTHAPEDQPSYYSTSDSDPNRVVVLEDGSLYIDFVLRSDTGPYTCIARNPRNSSQVIINVFLDCKIIETTYLWSLVVGAACAASFFVLNLTYSLILAGVRRCISQRRRERIRQIIESMDQYRTQQLNRIKENYHHQVGRIRDQYHYQLGRIREHHQGQTGRMGRMREGASQKVEKLRENYNSQLGRLKEYSSDQLSQIRGRYNNQIDKIKDFGSDKLDKILEKYKLKQQHVIRLLDLMNFDNCRTVFESECVRTESMILQSDIFANDIPLHTPIDSISVSDSEYMTASSSESSKYNSQENIDNSPTKQPHDSNKSTPIHPYLPEEGDNPANSGDIFKDSLADGITPSCSFYSTQGDHTEIMDPLKPAGHHVKRGSSRKHSKRHNNLDPDLLSKQFHELLLNDEASEMAKEKEWTRNSNSDQLRPLLVRGHDEESQLSTADSGQGLLQDNGADLSHLVVDMPVVSVDNVRETVV